MVFTPPIAPITPIIHSRVQTIEWDMLDKRRFYPYSMVSSFTVRCFLYPLTLVRTRLQVQHQNALYKGTFDAFSKILKSEGIKGLYTGFWISCFQVVSGLCYVSTYEGVRHMLDNNGVKDNKIKALVGGASASLVGQTIIVPFDVISQHLMILGTISKKGDVSANPLAINTTGRTKSQVAWDVTRTIYKRDGFRGFYRGYIVSLCNYVPNSAMWWTFYQVYQDMVGSVAHSILPYTGVQCVAAVMSGCTTSVLLNPMDLVRTRVQVQRKTIPDTIRFLWASERLNIFTKGLTARMTSSSIYSLAVILGYESVKKMSVLPEYKQNVRW
ncbi:solute carrier family 25 member 44 [Eurytemora carolleeae]|uniref:solute carrier family 25 member 44 n=1 Tax=Eurytemora carolleeae TaxID=1294199 RepID=UPI000C7819E7|nr:solute carrier family 25 member 44 [Eurytemora carolleeae]XP_023323151.1 solute carrier family 25 member 44 [Eurytemora carolleeae]XP_023323152.1 solute carrier family 25 member 44 [Eurytemora carolleeae]XP_023323153.1 solute carrier family 25 member 44 [Eurytemora carolleeae]|eukprot:XP_023323150.1 solute carrier family 25 member 44-like [Eurytemora affinis]